MRFLSRRIDDPSDGSEAALRTQRYAALRDMAAASGARSIATAHTADDQTETVLLRLLRGAGRRGLSGIPASRDDIIRPLLGERREMLRTLLDELSVEWVAGSSNLDPRYARNRIRHAILPAIAEQFGADATAHVPRMAARWAAEEDYLDGEDAAVSNLCPAANERR